MHAEVVAEEGVPSRAHVHSLKYLSSAGRVGVVCHVRGEYEAAVGRCHADPLHPTNSF